MNAVALCHDATTREPSKKIIHDNIRQGILRQGNWDDDATRRHREAESEIAREGALR